MRRACSRNTLPARQEAHAARRSLEERRAELVLERADLATERGLAHVEALGGATDVSLLGDRDEVAHLLEAHAAELIRDRNGIGFAPPIARTMHG